jgi:hypothetical protein
MLNLNDDSLLKAQGSTVFIFVRPIEKDADAKPQ